MNKNSVVLYKNSVAVVNEIEADKYIIKYCSQPASPSGKKAVYNEQKVREKDLVVLHEGPVSSLENLLSFSDEKMSSQIEEVYELLQSDSTTENQPLSLQELSEYARNSFIADESWAFYTSLVNDVHFSLSTEDLKNGKIVFIPRTSKEIEQINQKKYEKEHESEIKAAFFERLKNRKLDLPSDAKYMGEVEAFALCKTDKSKVLAEAKIPQTVEKAREMDLLTYLQNYEPNELVRLSDGTYCTRTHDSLKISNGKWMWWSRGFGGYSALDYLIKVKGLGFVQAVETIVGKCAVTQNINLQKKEIKQPKPLLLPDKSAQGFLFFDNGHTSIPPERTGFFLLS